MHHSLFYNFVRAVPPPKFLTMPAAGLDISDDAVKFVDLAATPKGNRVRLFGRRKLPGGAVEGGEIKKPEAVTECVRALHADLGIQFVHASLPEEHSYLFHTEVEAALSYDEKRIAIEFHLKENVPLSPEEVVFDFETLPAPAAHRMVPVAVYAYPRAIIEKYLKVLRAAAVTPLSLETEGRANVRAIVPYASAATVMLVDVGKRNTIISIAEGQRLVFTTSVEVSGTSFTEAIQRFLQISSEEAERVKAQRGFIKSDENNELFEALLGSVSNLRDGITKHLTYWRMHGDTVRREAHGDIQTIYLCGGGASMPGLQEYLAATLNVAVEMGNPWVNIAFFEEYIPPILHRDALQYTTALGLGLRSLHYAP